MCAYFAPATCAGANKWGKYLMTLVIGLDAAWPNPQIEASRMHCDSSARSAVFQLPRSINMRAFCVPDLQGVH